MKSYRLTAVFAAGVMILAGQAGMMVYAGGSDETESAVEEEDRAVSETEALEQTVVREGKDQNGISWTERAVLVKSSREEDVSTLTLRFYEDMPHVPYISASLFHDFTQPDRKVELTVESDGVYILANDGGKAAVDTLKDRISYDDYYSFTNTMGSSPNTKAGEAIDGAPFARCAAIEAEQDSGAMEFDFAKYSIDLRGDEEGAYIPFTTISNLYDDTSFLYRASYNSEEIVFSNDQIDIGMEMVDPVWYDPILKMETRPEDLASYSYSQLCFSLEHFYGYPGSQFIDEAVMKEQGLDAALKAYGEMGENASRLLQSTDMAEYVAGSERLRLLVWDGDHTNIDFLGGSQAFLNPDGMKLVEKVQSIDEELDDGYLDLQPELVVKPKTVQSVMNFEMSEARRKSLGEGTYFSKGNTAWCVFDEFGLDKEAWDSYYADENKDLDALLERENPDSAMILLSALKKAQADPQITNFVVDMTMNPGGNDGIAAFLESLLTGESRIPMIDKLTGNMYTVVASVDRNLDGVFDEKDDEVSYDFHFAVLLGGLGYSNATIASAILKDSGILTLGEPTRGGCCSLQCMTTAEGLEFLMSSGRMHHVYKNGDSIDAGVEPDIYLYQYDEEGNRIEIIRDGVNGTETFDIIVPDYSLFYDIESVGKIIDEYYGTSPE